MQIPEHFDFHAQNVLIKKKVIFNQTLKTVRAQSE